MKLNDVILALENIAQKNNKAICKIKINGLVFSEKDERKFATLDLHEIDEIEVEVENTQQLLRDSTRSICEFIGRLKVNSLNLADELRAQVNHESQLHFSGIISSILWLTEALAVVKQNLRINYTDENVDLNWKETEDKTKAAVVELTESYEIKDYARVSDVLEYEITTILDAWQAMLKFES